MLDGLEAEGVAAVLVHWTLAEDIRAVARVRDALQGGKAGLAGQGFHDNEALLAKQQGPNGQLIGIILHQQNRNAPFTGQRQSGR